jgi:2-keto-4-pentenoate hydratase/2-oxohepta-3-ene-1,7-dioic acid hydratase in catechol pathway
VQLIRYEIDGGPRLGASHPDGEVLELTGLIETRFGWRVTDVGEFLAHGRELEEWTADLLASPGSEASSHRFDELALLAPVGPSALIIGLGRNFAEHAREMRAGRPVDVNSSELHGFVKSARALTGSGREIVLPAAHPDFVDYEGEIGIVIGKRCHGVSAVEAEACIAGYVLLNDVSARDWIPQVRSAEGSDAIRLAWDSNTLGKQFPTFCPMGPYFVSKDAAAPVAEIELRTFVNGELRQQTSLDDLQYGPGEMIAHYAAFYEFQPGDIVTTGTPSGVGIGMKPPRFLAAGDRVTITATSLGTLENLVAPAGSKEAS